jgi:hypothetical protein
MATLIYQYTLPDEVNIAVEFICGDASPTHTPPDIIVRCDESIAGDFDCDDVHAVVDRLIDETIDKTHGRFPSAYCDLHAAIVARLMRYRADAAIRDHED